MDSSLRFAAFGMTVGAEVERDDRGSGLGRERGMDSGLRRNDGVGVALQLFL